MNISDIKQDIFSIKEQINSICDDIDDVNDIVNTIDFYWKCPNSSLLKERFIEDCEDSITVQNDLKHTVKMIDDILKECDTTTIKDVQSDVLPDNIFD